MITLLSPAKDLDMSMPPTAVKGFTQPRFLEESERLVTKLRTLSVRQVAKLMDLSPKLAELNRQRYQDWSVPFTAKNAKPAALAFNGEVYKGLGAGTLSANDLAFAQKHVRILSGLYGLLNPRDLMQAYRLEMGCGFSMGRGAKDLYAFWGDRITEAINEDLELQGAETVINLASGEYFKSVRPKTLRARVITPLFKDKAPGGYKMLMLFAKHQRGRMCRWIIEHRTALAEDLKRYDADGYRFNKELSEGDEWVFTRDKR
jgi:cytoplasmic iron level regulating protein YaaA (DUF328/UPF0246 family)